MNLIDLGRSGSHWRQTNQAPGPLSHSHWNIGVKVRHLQHPRLQTRTDCLCQSVSGVCQRKYRFLVHRSRWQRITRLSCTLNTEPKWTQVGHWIHSTHWNECTRWNVTDFTIQFGQGFYKNIDSVDPGELRRIPLTENWIVLYSDTDQSKDLCYRLSATTEPWPWIHPDGQISETKDFTWLIFQLHKFHRILKSKILLGLLTAQISQSFDNHDSSQGQHDRHS